MNHSLKKLTVQFFPDIMLIIVNRRGGGYFTLFNNQIKYSISFSLIPNLQDLILRYSKVICSITNDKIRYFFRVYANFFVSTHFFYKKTGLDVRAIQMLCTSFLFPGNSKCHNVNNKLIV